MRHELCSALWQDPGPAGDMLQSQLTCKSMQHQSVSEDLHVCHDLSCCSAGRSRGTFCRERVCAWQFVVTHTQSPSTLRVTFSLGKTTVCDSLLGFWLQDFRHICSERRTPFFEVFLAPVAAVMKSGTVVEKGLDRQNSVQCDQQFSSMLLSIDIGFVLCTCSGGTGNPLRRHFALESSSPKSDCTMTPSQKSCFQPRDQQSKNR